PPPLVDAYPPVRGISVPHRAVAYPLLSHRLLPPLDTGFDCPTRGSSLLSEQAYWSPVASTAGEEGYRSAYASPVASTSTAAYTSPTASASTPANAHHSSHASSSPQYDPAPQYSAQVHPFSPPFQAHAYAAQPYDYSPAHNAPSQPAHHAQPQPVQHAQLRPTQHAQPQSCTTRSRNHSQTHCFRRRTRTCTPYAPRRTRPSLAAWKHSTHSAPSRTCSRRSRSIRTRNWRAAQPRTPTRPGCCPARRPRAQAYTALSRRTRRSTSPPPSMRSRTCTTRTTAKSATCTRRRTTRTRTPRTRVTRTLARAPIRRLVRQPTTHSLRTSPHARSTTRADTSSSRNTPRSSLTTGTRFRMAMHTRKPGARPACRRQHSAGAGRTRRRRRRKRTSCPCLTRSTRITRPRPPTRIRTLRSSTTRNRSPRWRRRTTLTGTRTRTSTTTRTAGASRPCHRRL
ncbi:hypothetical protein GGX14DRAFT_460825, partial [Mycena pura]